MVVLKHNTWAMTWQNKQNECAPSKDSDLPGHPPSLIRVFAVRMKKAWVLSYPLSAQRRLWLDWADAVADLSLRWAHSHFVGFVMLRHIWIYFLNLHCCSQGIFPIDVGGWLLGGGGGGAVSRDGGGTPAIQIKQYFLQAMVRHHSCINTCKHSCLKLNNEIHVQIWNSSAVWTWFLLKNPQSRTLLVYMKFKKQISSSSELLRNNSLFEVSCKGGQIMSP